MIQPQSLIFAFILWRSYVHVRQPQFLGSFILLVFETDLNQEFNLYNTNPVSQFLF